MSLSFDISKLLQSVQGNPLLQAQMRTIEELLSKLTQQSVRRRTQQSTIGNEEVLKEAYRFLFGLSQPSYEVLAKLAELAVPQGFTQQGEVPIYRSTQIPAVIALQPINRPFGIYGPPGIGKTTMISQTARLMAEALGRELIDLSAFSPREIIEELVPEIRKSPEKFFLLGTVKGFDITRETYQIPETYSKEAFVPTIYPIILPFTITREMVRRFLEENPNLENELMEVIKGEIGLGPGPQVAPYLKYFPLGILFIDEAFQAFKDFVNYYIQGLLGERHWASTQLSPLVKLIIAYNPPEYNVAVTLPPVPVYRRFIRAEITSPTVEEIYRYVLNKLTRKFGRPPLPFVYALLKTFEDLLLKPPTETEMSEGQPPPYPTPAGWVQFLEMAYPYLEAYYLSQSGKETFIPLITSLAGQVLGPEVKTRLETYLAYATPPAYEIVQKPERFIEALIEAIKAGKERNIPWLPEAVKYKMLYELVGYMLAPKNMEELAKRYIEGMYTVARLMIPETKMVGEGPALEFIRNLFKRFGIEAPVPAPGLVKFGEAGHRIGLSYQDVAQFLVALNELTNALKSEEVKNQLYRLAWPMLALFVPPDMTTQILDVLSKIMI